MILGTLLDIETAIRSFFASLSASISYNLIFILSLALEAILIIFFVVKSRFSYEMRMTRSLDRLNKWLFVNKKLDTDNIKEFTNLVKKAPKRLAYNWQQYILYREKHPSDYISVDNIIEKPLRTSSLAQNIKNLAWFSAALILLVFIVGIAHSNAGDAILNGPMLIIALITPLLMLAMLVVAIVILSARKNTNLDLLYQNHHLFQRFIDNACVDLPQFIDFTLLFTVEEIEKGIPALREFLEARARKEKEEFDKARSEMVEYEAYDFEKAGIDGSNILERAMNESEAYLSNKSKTLAKISQFEASLESLKRNFENIQKDFQKKMQVSKENIDRLRQQQEETTSRIESNFLRKQQATEIAKQEKEEADFEQQKRRYLVEKNDYEEEIKNLTDELENGKHEVEKAMLSEYQTFYTRLCKSAADTVDQTIKDQIEQMKKEREQTEDELAKTQTDVKRLIDENQTLRLKLKNGESIDGGELVERVEPAKNDKVAPKAEEKEDKPKKEKDNAQKEPKAEQIETFVLEDEAPEYDDFTEQDKPAEKAPEVKEPEAEEVKPEAPADANSESFVLEEPEVEYDYSIQPEQAPEQVASQTEEPNVALEEASQTEEPSKAVEEGVEQTDDNAEEDILVEEDDFDVYPQQEEPKAEVKENLAPAESTESATTEVTQPVKRPRGRPRKVVAEPENKEKRKRGRPLGSTKKVNSPSVKKKEKAKIQPNGQKRSRGRPRKQSVEDLNKRIEEEQKRLESLQNDVNSQLNESLKTINQTEESDRKKLIEQIDALKSAAESANNQTSTEDLETLSQKIENLLAEINKLENKN